MASTEIALKLPKVDATDSICLAQFTATTIGADMVIKNALKNKNNSLVIVATITTAGTLTIKAGNKYANRCLGDLALTLTTGTAVITIEDCARFENRDGSINITTATTAGTIFAVAKREGVLPVADQ